MVQTGEGVHDRRINRTMTQLCNCDAASVGDRPLGQPDDVRWPRAVDVDSARGHATHRASMVTLYMMPADGRISGSGWSARTTLTRQCTTRCGTVDPLLVPEENRRKSFGQIPPSEAHPTPLQVPLDEVITDKLPSLHEHRLQLCGNVALSMTNSPFPRAGGTNRNSSSATISAPAASCEIPLYLCQQAITARLQQNCKAFTFRRDTRLPIDKIS